MTRDMVGRYGEAADDGEAALSAVDEATGALWALLDGVYREYVTAPAGGGPASG